MRKALPAAAGPHRPCNVQDFYKHAIGDTPRVPAVKPAHKRMRWRISGARAHRLSTWSLFSRSGRGFEVERGRERTSRIRAPANQDARDA